MKPNVYHAHAVLAACHHGMAANLFVLWCRCAADKHAAFRAAAGYFLLRRQKKVSKEKATRGCSKPRAKRPAPGAAELSPC